MWSGWQASATSLACFINLGYPHASRQLQEEVPVIVLELQHVDTRERSLVAWDARGAWHGKAQESAERVLRVETLARWEQFPDGTDVQDFADGLLRFAEEHKLVLLMLRYASVIGSTLPDARQLTVLLRAQSTKLQLAALPQPIAAIIPDLERADMSASDRKAFVGRPQGVGF